MRGRKKNNNLILINYTDGEKRYYTSFNRAGLSIGLAPVSVKWALDHENVITDLSDRELTIKLVDGSNIQYKYINN